MFFRESQEQSIKARKHELFEDEQHVIGEPLRSFSDYLHETSAAPLSGTDKAILGAVGVVVLLLFCAAIYTMIQGPRPQSPAAISKTSPSGSLPR